MIVVDTNVIAYLWIPGTQSVLSEKALERDREWIAPPLWVSEFRNILIRYLHSGYIGIETAAAILEQAESLFLDAVFPVRSETVMKLAARSTLTPYDCEFAGLALEKNVFLVTSDKKMLKAFPEWTVSLRRFAGGETKRVTFECPGPKRESSVFPGATPGIPRSGKTGAPRARSRTGRG
jgi:predicted nucleic acid-binding protein